MLKFVYGGDGVVWSEVAPSNYSTRDLDNYVDEIFGIKEYLSEPSLDGILSSVESPCVKFAVYGAIKQLEWNMNSKVNVASESGVSVNALLIGSDERVFSRFEHLYRKGMKIFKLKLDINNYQFVLNRLKDMKGMGISLVVDFNRNFDLETALKISEVLSELGFVAYIEDPIDRIEQLNSFLNNSNIKVGLDEYISKDWDTVESFLDSYKDRVIVVVKPSVLYGSKQWEKILDDVMLKKVFTSYWEIGIGTRAVLMMSYEINGGSVHTGVGTYSYIKDDICKPTLDVEKPKIPLREILTPVSVDESKLEFIGEVKF